MQQKEEKSIKFAITLGSIVKKLRKNKQHITMNTLANEYELYKGTISKIENGTRNCQLITLWKISEALNIKCSDIVKMLEEELGEDFKFMEE